MPKEKLYAHTSSLEVPLRLLKVEDNLRNGEFAYANRLSKDKLLLALAEVVPYREIPEDRAAVEINDYGSGGLVSPKDYFPDKAVSLFQIPDNVESVEVTVDNGRLGIYLNDKCIFYKSSLLDGAVRITRKAPK